MCQKTSVSVASEDPHVPVCDSMQHVLQRGKANAINGPSFGLEIVGYTFPGWFKLGPPWVHGVPWGGGRFHILFSACLRLSDSQWAERRLSEVASLAISETVSTVDGCEVLHQWLLPLGFQDVSTCFKNMFNHPSVWWCRISQPSAVCRHDFPFVSD
jgi:hypothetical protein